MTPWRSKIRRFYQKYLSRGADFVGTSAFSATALRSSTRGASFAGTSGLTGTAVRLAIKAAAAVIQGTSSFVATAYQVVIRESGAALHGTSSLQATGIIVPYDPLTFTPALLLDANDSTITEVDGKVSQWDSIGTYPIQSHGATALYRYSGGEPHQTQSDASKRPVKLAPDALGHTRIEFASGTYFSDPYLRSDDRPFESVLFACAFEADFSVQYGEARPIAAEFIRTANGNDYINFTVVSPIGTKEVWTPPTGLETVWRPNQLANQNVTGRAWVVMMIGRNVAGNTVRGICVWLPKANNKSFCFYDFENDLASDLPFPMWQYSAPMIGNGSTTTFALGELLLSASNFLASDAESYMKSLVQKWMAQRMKNFVFFQGDSITYGYALTEAESYPYKVMMTLNGGIEADWFNAGVSGRKLAEMVVDIPTYKPLYRPFKKNVAVIFEGINDNGYQQSPYTWLPNDPRWVNAHAGVAGGHEGMLANLWTVCDTMRIRGYKVIVCTIIPAPCHDANGNATTYHTEYQAYNQGIRDGWAAHAAALCDFAALPEFNNWGNGTEDSYTGAAAGANGGSFGNMTYYQTDNIHPTAAGLSVLAAAIQPIIQTQLASE